VHCAFFFKSEIIIKFVHIFCYPNCTLAGEKIVLLEGYFLHFLGNAKSAFQRLNRTKTYFVFLANIERLLKYRADLRTATGPEILVSIRLCFHLQKLAANYP
jgi:hypothetical protein